MITFRGGWLPHPADLPEPRFDAALRTAVTPPASADWYSAVPIVGMHANNLWGDCVEASLANIIQGETWYGQGNEVIVDDPAVIAAYSAITGFNPNAGGPGSNPTDNGTNIADGLAYLKATGMAGHNIAAYGRVGVSDHARVMTCAAEFGYASIGINLPNSAVDQFNSVQVWDVVKSDGGSDGGHCTAMCGYTPVGPVAWTWGRPQQMTWSFWDAYVEECWPVVSHDWISAASGKDPDGVDLVTLGAEFQSVTGQNPFRPVHRYRHWWDWFLSLPGRLGEQPPGF